MNLTGFNSLTRRASLLMLGTGSRIAALASPLIASAKKTHGRSKLEKEDADNLRLWKKQIGQWRPVFTPSYDDAPDGLDAPGLL